MRMTWDPLKGIGFRYDPSIEYNNHGLLTLGRMIQTCRYCEALKLKGEPLGICCSNGKVKLPLIPEPLDPLKTLLIGKTPHSKAYLNKIRKYNSCFQMTSFWISGQVVSHNYPATFTVQGQIYHRIGSILPTPDQPYSFLQVSFIGDQQAEAERRCDNIPGVSQNTVQSLQRMLHNNNVLVRYFKTAIGQWPSDDLKVVIRAYRRLAGEQERRFNSPTVNEVAVVIVGKSIWNASIIWRLEYALIFWNGQEGYHFQIQLINLTTNLPTN